MQKNYIRCAILVILLDIIIPALAFGQSGEKDNAALIVNNSLEGKWHGKKIALRVISVLGGNQETDETKMFYKIADFKVDVAGNMYVLERGNKRVLKFDPKGNYLLSMGRAGQGPGEFADPYSIQILDDQSVYVLDKLQATVTKFSAKGDYQNSFRLTRTPDDFAVNAVNQIITLENNFTSTNETHKLFVYSEKGILLSTVGQVVDAKDPFAKAVLNGGRLAIDRTANHVYVTLLQPYRIEKYDLTGNSLVGIFNRQLNYEVIKPETQIEKYGDKTAVRFNFYTRITVDVCVGGGKIFHLVNCKNSMVPEGDCIDIFTLAGEYLAQIELENSAKIIEADAAGNIYLVYEPLELPDFIKKKSSGEFPYIIKYKLE